MDRLRTELAHCIGVALAITIAGCTTFAPVEAPAPAVEPAPPASPPPPPPVVAPPTPVPVPTPPVGGAPRPETAFKPVLYKLWYATNRTPVIVQNEVVDYSPKWDKRSIHYGNIYAEIPEDYLKKMNDTGWLARLFRTSEAKLRLTKPIEIAEQSFVGQLKRDLLAAASDERQVLIYLHGFNTTFKEAAQRAASIGYQLKMPTTAFFSWPSQGGMRNYPADKDLSELSQDSIADFLLQASSEWGAKKVHLIAHSMGNHALLGAMYRPKMQQAIRDGLRFGQVILAAPDVETERFKRDVGIFSGIADRVSLYVSDGDIALRASRQVASGLSRAGLRPPIVVVNNIDTVDVSSTNLTLLGHSYVSQEVSVLTDMHSLILHNDPPEKRINLLRKGDHWVLH